MKNSMKRNAFAVLIIIISFLLQSVLFPHLAFANIRPNLMVIVVAAYGFMRGKRTGLWVGVCCGLLTDVFWGGLIGFYTLIYAVIGYVNGSFQRMFYDDDIKLPLVLISGSDLVQSIIVYVGYFLLRGKFHFAYSLGHIILPELVYTILATLILYQIILHINRKLDKEEQRSASRFV